MGNALYGLHCMSNTPAVDEILRELVPLIVPLTLLKHHVATQDVPEWLHQQVYLNPSPKELLLRNHV